MMNSPECNHDPETTVACHLNDAWAGTGLAQKADDVAVFFGCSDCHRWYDEPLSRKPMSISRGIERTDYVFRACVRTWRYLIETGVLS